MKLRKLATAAALVAACGSVLVAGNAFAQAKEQFIPVLSYRTGPYAPNGVPWADGFVDYLKLVNERDGGVNGVKIAFEEGQTGYPTDRGVEWYERRKRRKPVPVNPPPPSLTHALTAKEDAHKNLLF